jgi:hypothetical protein
VTASRALSRSVTRAPASPDTGQELAAYCAFPKCRREFRCTLGPGRKKAFCSDICRRNAEKELRQLRSRLTHLETMVEQARIDVAAYGRTESADGESDPTLVRRTAEDAVTRVAGILDFVAGSDEPMSRELRRLYDAVVPVLRSP